MKESKFSKCVCSIITSACGGHVSRVEAAESAAGIPDLDYCVNGNEGHIELKVGSYKKSLELRPSQVRWFRKRIAAGGSPFFLCLDTDHMNVYVIDGNKYQTLAGKHMLSKWIFHADYKLEWGDGLLVGLRTIIKEKFTRGKNDV